MSDFMKGEAGPVFFIVLYLLPGLLGTVIYDYLVEGEKRDNFERVLHALVLTLLSTLLVHGVFRLPVIPEIEVGKETAVTAIIVMVLDRNLLIMSLVAVGLTVVWACLHNHDIIYGCLNRLGVTYKKSKSDVWQDVLNRHRGYWIQVQFQDGKTLVGWPMYYSASGKPREMFLANASWWLPCEDGDVIQTTVDGPGVYISDFSKVTAITLLDGNKGEANG